MIAFRSTAVRAAQRVGLGPALHRSLLWLRGLTSTPARLRWRSAVDRFARRGISPAILHGTPDPGALPVVVCLWNRPSRIRDLLSQLAGQEAPVPLRVMLWNNQPTNDAHYRAAISALTDAGAIASIEYVSSPTNLGGIARFLAARHARSTGQSGPFVMLDDDQDISPTFVADLLAAYAPHTYAGWWVWRMDGSYWARTEVQPGEPANYVGTGGSICDSELVADDRFFSSLPYRYGFLEDIWASAWAQRLGWRMTKVDTDISFVMSELDQAHTLADLKREFFDYLARPGWAR
ncbi:hypothetical protein [Mycetocola sp. 2940]|uniref:glycosyltransferase family 2 protein n=1 Tax=Mycetocola sp. 2940 TaxID=3156452 RepID=UPI003392A596